MAWAVKYRGEFYDLKGLYWRINVEEDSYGGAIGEMKMGGSPLAIEHMTGGDDLLLNPIKGSQATFGIISETNFQWIGLYSAENLKYRTSIFYNGASGLNSWTNISYNTFTASGLNVTTAVNSGADTAIARTNGIDLQYGDIVTVMANLTLNSGTAPKVYLYADGSARSPEETTLNEGANTITLTCNYNGFVYVYLEVDDNTDFSLSGVTITSSGYALYWRGYLTSDYSEPYEDTPYQVSVTATDALGLLKDMPYKYTTLTTDDTYYDGRRYESQVILDCLGKIGFTSFKEFCNIYEDNINSGIGDSPFDQVQIDVDVFRDMNCYQVLEQILIKYNAVIRQTRGEFWIYRPVELDQASVNYRYFTAYNIKTNSTIAPAQAVSHPSALTNYNVFPGGRLMMQGPWKKFTATQDYGSKDSWLDNHNFIFNEDTQEFDFWTRTAGPIPLKSSAPLSKELEGVLIPVDPTLTSIIYQQFGANAVVNSNEFVLEFDYRFIKTTAGDATNREYRIKINDVAENYWLDEGSVDGTAEWSASEAYIRQTIADVPQGYGSWETVKLQFTGLPVAGPYICTLYPTNGTLVQIAYKNVRFYCTSDELVIKTRKPTTWDYVKAAVPIYGVFYVAGGGIKTVTTSKFIDNEERTGRVYEAENDIEGAMASQDYLLGDCEDTKILNVIEQFRGSLAVTASEQLDVTADDFVNDHAAAYLPGNVVVTAADNVITFTGNTTSDFSGSTTITNTSGTLSGTVANVQAASAAVNAQHTIQLAGTSGTADITVENVTATATFATNLNTTAANFVTNFAATYAAANITVTASSDILTFEADNGYFDPNYTSTITNVTGDLTGDVDMEAQAYSDGVVRIDTITLTGSTGAASILCDGVTRTVDVTAGTTLQYSRSWHTRGNTEALPVIKLIAEEIKGQYAREKHFIQMNIRESGTSPDIDVVKNVQDSLNTVGGNNRVFAINRGTFDVFNREWSLDLIEII